MDLVCWIPLCLLCFISAYLNPNPIIQLFYFLRVLVTHNLHITPFTFCHVWKGTLISLMYWKYIPATFLPIFLFPSPVSIIQALSLSQNFPCSCILTCWSFLCSCSVMQHFLFVHASQMLIWAPSVQFSGLSLFSTHPGSCYLHSLHFAWPAIFMFAPSCTWQHCWGCCLIQCVLRVNAGVATK